jgi:site-specific DNA-methyltransferase (adenine-specific)
MHQAGNIRLFNADNMELMKQVPDGYYELAIVDPPYGLERFKKGGSIINKHGSECGHWNNIKPTREYFDELFRISKNQIIWGANNFELPPSEYYIIWQKSNAENFSFAMCEMAWTNCKIPAKIFKHYHVQTENKNKIHPTQKPAELYKWLLSKYAKQGDKILDTHAGSFSIGIACEEMGFSLDAMELDTDYFNQSWERFERHLRQPKLFKMEQTECNQEDLF